MRKSADRQENTRATEHPATVSPKKFHVNYKNIVYFIGNKSGNVLPLDVVPLLPDDVDSLCVLIQLIHFRFRYAMALIATTPHGGETTKTLFDINNLVVQGYMTDIPR